MTHSMKSSPFFAARAGRETLMKRAISILGGVALLAGAGTAAAQEEVEVAGEAEAMCAFTGDWDSVSVAGGASLGDFNGSAWNFPSSALANSSGQPVTGGEYAIRIRAEGSCNTSHTITVTSARGGLSAVADGSAPPSGFANRRTLNYGVYWSNGSGGAYGPSSSQIQNWQPSTPGQSLTRTFTVSGSWAPPGVRGFDIRMGMARPAMATPLIQGAYSDTLTVTLAVLP